MNSCTHIVVDSEERDKEIVEGEKVPGAVFLQLLVVISQSVGHHGVVFLNTALSTQPFV